MYIRTVFLFQLPCRPNYIKIHGIKYASSTIVRVKGLSAEENLLGGPGDFVYCYVHNIYIYKDHKIFDVEIMNVLSFKGHIRAIHVTYIDQRMWCHHNDLFCHGILHLLTKDENTYIIDKLCCCTLYKLHRVY